MHDANTIWHVVVHTSENFGLVWAMLGETIVPNHHNGVNEHDRCTSFLIYPTYWVALELLFPLVCYFSWTLFDTMNPLVRISKDFDKFLFFMNFWRFSQTTVDQSLWLVHELLESYKWCYVVTLWCSISPRCPFLVCKRHFGRCFTNGSLNLSFFM